MFEADLEVEYVPGKIRMIKRLYESIDTTKQKREVNKNSNDVVLWSQTVGYRSDATDFCINVT